MLCWCRGKLIDFFFNPKPVKGCRTRLNVIKMCFVVVQAMLVCWAWEKLCFSTQKKKKKCPCSVTFNYDLWNHPMAPQQLSKPNTDTCVWPCHQHKCFTIHKTWLRYVSGAWCKYQSVCRRRERIFHELHGFLHSHTLCEDFVEVPLYIWPLTDTVKCHVSMHRCLALLKALHLQQTCASLREYVCSMLYM